MPISNYPNGFAQGVAIRGLPILNTYGGNVFWVDSNNGADTGKGTHNQCFETWDYTVGRCVAGDIIILKAGHVETVTAAAGLALDVAGVTTIFLGSGANKAYVTFTTDVGADMDVDAASITLINPKFVAGIDALTGPIDVNAADFTIVNGEYHDATDIETTDCIVGVAAATRFCLDGWKYFKSNEGGTQKESHIQLNGVDDLTLKNIHVEGDFDVGIIENLTDECLRMTMEDHYLKNTDPGNAPCAVLDSECSGWATRLNWRNANGTVVDDVADINWAPDALGYTTDGYSGDPIGTAAASGVEGKLDVIDEYHDVPAQNNILNAQINEVIGNKTDALAAGAVTETDTLVGYIKQLVTAAIADAAQTLKLDGVTIATAPTAASLASFIASGGTALGTQLPASFSLLDMMRGKQVSRTAADVFDGSQTPLFTVSGGRVLVKALVGEVSVAAIDAGASNTSFVTNPTVGTDAAMCAVLDINADENGTIYALSGNPANALTGGSGGGASCMDRCFIVPEGTIDLLSAADVGTGGALGAFDIWYIPLDTGATITST